MMFSTKSPRTGWKLPLIALAAGCALVAAFRLARRHRPLMEWVADRVSMPLKRTLSGLVDPLPFSMAELLCTVLILWGLWYLARGLWLQLHGVPVLLPRLLVLAAVGVWVYAGFCLLWGVHYYTESFAEKSGLEAPGATVDQLEATALFFRDKVNETAGAVRRTPEGAFDYTWQELFADTPGLYDKVTEVYPCLAGPERRAKPAFYSRGMSVTRFTGYLFPFLGESTLNVDCPAVFLPATVGHEFSHQRGVAQEQQANFVGVEACVLSGKPAYVYSGWLFGYLHLSNALYGADPERWAAVDEGLCEEARRDFAVNNAYWAQFEKKTVTKVVQTTYENFLYSYDQELGMRSYGACVDLLVARYGPAAE